MVAINPLRTIRTGALNGIRAFLKLMVVVAPVYTFVTIIKYTPLLATFARLMAPFMRFFRLPGEAAMALILGNFINIYAALGAITALKINGAQFTVLSLMILISHSQILETAVFFKIKAMWWLLWVIRLIVSFAIGAALAALIVPPGNYTTGSADFTALQQRFTFIPALKNWAVGLTNTASKMLLVLIGIFIILELTKSYGILEKILRGVKKTIGFMGYNETAGMPWLAGNVFGIVFGAGLIVQSVKEGSLSSRQVTLVATFLALCHGLFEDTAIFVVLGANLFWIVVPRVVLAVAITWLLSRLIKEDVVIKEKK